MPVNKRFFEALMKEKHLSLRGLAGKMGMNHSQLSLTFSGARRMQLDEAAKLAEILGLPLYRVAEAAGVSTSKAAGRRVNVIGSMTGSGVVDLYGEGVTERTIAPEGIGNNLMAVQARTSETPLGWMDGWVFFFNKTDIVEPDCIGRFCVAKIENGPAVLATLRRGYRDGTYNLSGPITRDSERLSWASPILMTRM